MFNLFKKSRKTNQLEEKIQEYQKAVKKAIDVSPRTEFLARSEKLIQNYDVLLQELPILQQRLDSVFVDEFDIHRRDDLKSTMDSEIFKGLEAGKAHIEKNYNALKKGSITYTIAFHYGHNLFKLVLLGSEFNQKCCLDVITEIKTILKKYENQLILQLNFDS